MAENEEQDSKQNRTKQDSIQNRTKQDSIQNGIEQDSKQNRTEQDPKQNRTEQDGIVEKAPPPKLNCRQRFINFWTCRPNDPTAPVLPYGTRLLNCLKPEQQEELAEGELPKREAWSNRFTFFISTLGMSVGLGQVWRFPTLAYKFGGGTFLVMYAVMTLLIGNGLFFFEIAQGQYSGKNLVRVYDKVPIAIGIGWAMISYAYFFTIYYNSMVGFGVYYFAASFLSPLPWTVCPKDEEHYDPVKCLEFHPNLGANMEEVTCGDKVVNVDLKKMCDKANSAYLSKIQSQCSTINQTDLCRPREYASEYYWSHTVNRLYRKGDPMYGYIGAPNWWLIVSLFIAWCLNFFALYKGLKSMAFMMYIMVPLPYIVLFIMFFVTIFQKGAAEGVRRFFTPEFKSFININAWRMATEQAFYSLGVAMGPLITFGSYSPFNAPSHVDAAVICLFIVHTSVLCSCVVFSILGFLSTTTGKPFDEMVTVGPGVVFIVYAESLNLMPASNFWALLFYFMIINLGSSTVSGIAESVASVVYTLWPKYGRIKYIVNAILFLSCFLAGLPITFRGGLNVYDAFDFFPAGLTLIPICSFELIAVIYIYGLGRFCEDVAYMLGGWYPNRFYRYQWMLGPFVLFGVFFYGLAVMAPMDWRVWTYILAWSLFFCVMGPILLGAFYKCHTHRVDDDCAMLLKPVPEHGPADPMDAKFRYMFVTNRNIF